MIKDSPIAWGLGGALLGGAVLLLAYFTSPLLVAVMAVGMGTAAGLASVRSSDRESGELGGAWQDLAARIATTERPGTTEEVCPSKFAAQLAERDRPPGGRMR